jgi:hypothetical protein
MDEVSEQRPPIHAQTPRSPRNLLIEVLPKFPEMQDVHYSWIAGEPKLQIVASDLSKIDLDARSIESELIVKAKLKVEAFYARSQMRIEGSNETKFAYTKAPQNFQSKLKNGSLTQTIWAICSQTENSTYDLPIAHQFEVIVDGEDPIPVEFFALCLGHKGSAAVNYVYTHLSSEIEIHLTAAAKNSQEFSDCDIYNSILGAFFWTNHRFKNSSPSKHSGCVVSGFLTIKGKLWPFNLGNARTDLVSSSGALQLTERAMLDDPRYLAAIERRGDSLELDDWVSPRSFGSKSLKGATGRPKIYEPIDLKDVEPKSKIIITSSSFASSCSSHKLGQAIKDIQEVSLQSFALNLVYSSSKNNEDGKAAALVVEFK